jgi:pSer/pThr/pTyr-binding forkhead associated (FHA) protein
MKICLVVAEGTQAGTEVPITKFPFIIGRAPSCQLRPSSEIISKQHCAFLVHKGRAFLRDLGSRNGTLVNGKRVQKTIALRDKDILTLGPLSFMIRVTDDVSVNQPTPLPPNRDSDPNMEPPGEEEVAALLLEMDAQEPPEEVTSKTIELPKPDGPREVLKAPESKAKPKENSSVAAQDLIKKLLRGGKA